MAAQAKSPSFERVMTELMAMAGHTTELVIEDEVNVYQVHALNSIKEIFKSTTLGQRSERHIAQGFGLAVDSMKSAK
jgi:DNA-binding IclR family transcriptional regulator